MLNTLIERLVEAAKNGEMLTVVYSGGGSPGSKRRVLPIRVAGHLLYARSLPSLLVKTYRLDLLSVVDDDFSAPWVDETTQGRLKPTIIKNPEEHFESWAYLIHKYLWSALGVTLREYVDKEKALGLRAEAKDLNAQYIAPKYLAYAISNPPAFDFQEGDLFFAKRDLLPELQVVARQKLLEVHEIFLNRDNDDTSWISRRVAYQLIDTELAIWLQTGVPPRHAQIDAALSYSEVLRYSISAPQESTVTTSTKL